MRFRLEFREAKELHGLTAVYKQLKYVQIRICPLTQAVKEGEDRMQLLGRIGGRLQHRHVAIAKSHPGLEVVKAKPKVAQRGAVKDQQSDCVIVMASRNFAKDWNFVQANPQRCLRQYLSAMEVDLKLVFDSFGWTRTAGAQGGKPTLEAHLRLDNSILDRVISLSGRESKTGLRFYFKKRAMNC